MECSSCKQSLSKAEFSSTQVKKKDARRCRSCVGISEWGTPDELTKARQGAVSCTSHRSSPGAAPVLSGADSVEDDLLEILQRVPVERLASLQDFFKDAVEETIRMREERKYARMSPKHRRKMNGIIEDLRAELPLAATAPGEKFSYPTTGQNAEFTEINTYHVDALLYTDDDIDRLEDEGELTRYYCNACGSKDVELLNFITHSASVPQLEFIYSVLGPLEGKTVLDIGSRLGGVLYVGHMQSRASRLVGVELSDYFSQLSSKIVKKHNMDDRVEIVAGDVRDQEELVKGADVIIMNNVFEFFFDTGVQEAMWKFIKKCMTRRGARLVSIPPLDEAFADAQITWGYSDWLKKIDVAPSFEGDEEDADNLGNIAFYEVI